MLLLLGLLLLGGSALVGIKELVVAFNLELVRVHLLLQAHTVALIALVEATSSRDHLPCQLLRGRLLELIVQGLKVGLVGRHLLVNLRLLLVKDLGLHERRLLNLLVVRRAALMVVDRHRLLLRHL